MPEPDNIADELAVAVYDLKKNHLGYIPRDHNKILARLLDGGKSLS